MKGLLGRLITRTNLRSCRLLTKPYVENGSLSTSRRFLYALSSNTPHAFSDFTSIKPSKIPFSCPPLWSHFGGQKRTMFIQTQSTPNPLSLMFYPGKPVVEAGSADFPNARSAMNSPLAKALFGIDGCIQLSPKIEKKKKFQSSAATGQYMSRFVNGLQVPLPHVPSINQLKAPSAKLSWVKQAPFKAVQMSPSLLSAIVDSGLNAMEAGITRVFFGSDFITVTKSEEASWDFLKPEIFAAIMDFFSSGNPVFLDSSTAASMDTAIHEDDSEIVAMIKELLETRIRPAVQDDGGDIVYRGFDPDTGVVKLKMQGACSGCPSSSVTLKSGIENMLMHYVPEVKSVEQELDEDEQPALTGAAHE
ncbi:hypothetical protein MTR67_047006 [Solanum verrucosum]|uniref:Scaffold protein Nfu/NifU N-terminal domain-containing protein n=1 Tax=Solanum verrucosum TaxID=315347 RepID=A0AAF0UYY9_SOLVR|nr:hypothetical protein MTR67_047006 [Solanum verrucosum]